MVQVSVLNKAITATCTVGIALCVYAYLIETRKEQDAKYQAACDISEHMSCSRVLSSPYGKGFGLVRHILGENSPLNVPNSIPGGVMYAVFAALSLVQSAWSAKAQIGLGIISNIASVYLGSILYFILKDFCVLCVTTYAINFINLVLSYLRLRALSPAGKGGKGQKGQQKSQKQQKQKGQSDKQKSPQAEKKKPKAEKQQQPQGEKQKSPKADKQKQPQQQQQNGKIKNQENKKQQQQQQQNGKAKNQQNEKQKSPKTPNSKKKN